MAEPIEARITDVGNPCQYIIYQQINYLSWVLENGEKFRPPEPGYPAAGL